MSAINLTISDIKKVKYKIALLESKGLGDTLAENKLGYLGRYQFGAMALLDVGLIDKKSYLLHTHYDKTKKARVWNIGYNNKKFINKKEYWRLARGKDDFLGNEALQESSMSLLIEKHYESLKNKKRQLSTKDDLFGYLMAAHLGGTRHALEYIEKKKDFKDALGTKISKYYKSGAISASVVKKKQNEIVALGKKYLGGKYLWGGTNPNGFDCSGYVKYIFNKKGISLPRTAYQQSKIGKDVSLNNIQKGDLLFFNTDPSRGLPVSHVGVYLENGKFIHAANKNSGIIISSLQDYKNKFVKAKRILGAKAYKEYTSKKTVSPTSTQIGKKFFRSYLEEAVYASTKVSLKDKSIKYEYNNGKYTKKDVIIKSRASNMQLW